MYSNGQFTYFGHVYSILRNQCTPFPNRYVKAHLTNDTMLKISLPKKGSLLILFTYFVLCRPVSVKVTGKKNKVDLRPQPYSPLEELQVMVSVLNKIEEQKSIEQQFCIFEALFGACEETIKVTLLLHLTSPLLCLTYHLCHPDWCQGRWDIL